MKQKLTFFLVVLFICNISFGQTHRFLNIPNVSQQTPTWCWAASMQMVINHYQPLLPVSQAELLVWYDSISGSPSPYLEMSHISTFSDLQRCIPQYRKYPEFWNSGSAGLGMRFLTTIPIDYGLICSPNPTSIEKLFTNRRFISNQVSTMNWVEIKTQIDQCKPVMIIENRCIGSSPCGVSAGHVVLAVGYNTLRGGKFNNVIAINDPSPCGCGSQYLITENYIKVNNSGNPISTRRSYNIISSVKDIVPTGGFSQASCSYIENDLFLELSNYFAQPNINNSLNTRLRYISFDKLLETDFTKINKFNWNSLNDGVLFNNYSKLKLKNNILYQYELFENKFELAKISKVLNLNLEPNLLINNKKINLSNRGKGIPYSIVENVEFGERYFRFRYDNKIYLVKMACYDEENLDIIKIDSTFTELKMLREIKNRYILKILNK